MGTLEVRLFGGLRLSRDTTDLPPFATRKAAGLFAFLVLHRQQSVHREVICARLWGERSEAMSRKALRTALWRIRCVVEPSEDERGDLIRIEPHRVGFRPIEAVTVDAWQLADAAMVRPAGDGRLAAEAVMQLEAAVRLYNGPLMEGEDADEWTLAESERFRQLHLMLLERLMAHYRAVGEPFEALATGQEILRHDPLLERVHREVMRCHVHVGDRAAAIRQYRVCVDVLSGELGLPPMAETVELNNGIRSGAVR